MQNKLLFNSLTNIKLNKYSLIITVLFFLASSYISFFHHHYWFEGEGIYYLKAGEQILAGDGKDVMIPDAAVGGPILLASLNSVFHNGFLVLKVLSLLSVTGIVLVSYFIIKNIFNYKIALLGQLFVAFNPQLDRLSIMSIMDGLPIFLIFVSLYFITKKQVKLFDIMLVGALLGASAMIRYQTILVFLAILVFLLIRDKKIKTNLSHVVFLSIFFVMVFSPIMIYNYSSHQSIIDSNSNAYMILEERYQTSEWQDKLLSSQGMLTSSIFHDFNLFLKNYFYNLFYNSDILFYFTTLGNVSIIPVIPYIGLIPVMGGLVYYLRPRLTKVNVSLILSSFGATILTIFLFGDFSIHFFAIIIIPFLVLGILYIKNVEKNFLPLLILPNIYFAVISIIPLYRGYQLFPMWIVIPILSSVFFIKTVPQVFCKIKKIIPIKKMQSDTQNGKIVSIVLISLVLITNLGFSYKLLDAYLYHDNSYDGIANEVFKLFRKRTISQESGFEHVQIGNILSKQLGIENSYIISEDFSYAYYAHSKFFYASFTEGPKNDTLDKYLTREDWSPWSLYLSNLNSLPMDRYNVFKPIPNYVVFQPPKLFNTTENNAAKILSNPKNSEIPSNWEVLYKSNKTGVIVYKINNELISKLPNR